MAVQYLVVRQDLVETMGTGKTAAQLAHASLGAILDEGQIIDTPATKAWLNGRFTKLVVYVKTKQKLLNLAEKLEEQEEIGVKLIYDACFTVLIPEEKDGTTLTCMGVEPLFEDKIPKSLKKLRLLP